MLYQAIKDFSFSYNHQTKYHQFKKGTTFLLLSIKEETRDFASKEFYFLCLEDGKVVKFGSSTVRNNLKFMDLN